MQRTIKLKLQIEEEDKILLLKTMELYTIAFNVSSDWGFKNKTANKIDNHKATYRTIRDLIPELPSSLLQGARDNACEALKSCKCTTMPVRRPHSSIRYNQRVANVYLKGNYATLASVKGRVKVGFIVSEHFNKYSDWKIKSSNLSYDKLSKTFYLSIMVEFEDIEPIKEEIILGIDRGIKNIVVSSDNMFYNAKEVNRVRGKYQHLRSELQSKGTKSAIRKLKNIAGKERRFMIDVNHCISKKLVNTDYTVFALEDLSKVRNQKRRGKIVNKMLNSWAFYDLEAKLKYKAEELGKKVIKVDARYTSQKCSKCNNIDKKNRNGHVFKCTSCGFELHADLNASRNIAQNGKLCLEQVVVNQPNATPMVVASLQL